SKTLSDLQWSNALKIAYFLSALSHTNQDDILRNKNIRYIYHLFFAKLNWNTQRKIKNHVK
ncbi:hypothetical protein K0G41_18515, partial [Bacteroides fragilis]|nr:hypothetical protein [Bacteroides fragilis]